MRRVWQCLSGSSSQEGLSPRLAPTSLRAPLLGQGLGPILGIWSFLPQNLSIRGQRCDGAICPVLTASGPGRSPCLFRSGEYSQIKVGVYDPGWAAAGTGRSGLWSGSGIQPHLCLRGGGVLERRLGRGFRAWTRLSVWPGSLSSQGHFDRWRK